MATVGYCSFSPCCPTLPPITLPPIIFPIGPIQLPTPV
jgi:hypothetical protein